MHLEWIPDTKTGRHVARINDVITYTCQRFGKRSKKYYARHKSEYLKRGTRPFLGTLEQCKAFCEQHHSINYVQGDA